MFEFFRTFACEQNSWIATNQPETNMAMAAKVEWTPEIVELLIESVRSQKVVWDSSCNGVIRAKINWNLHGSRLQLTAV